MMKKFYAILLFATLLCLTSSILFSSCNSTSTPTNTTNNETSDSPKENGSPKILDFNELLVVGVTASDDDGNVPANTLDRDLSTRWSAEGDGQLITFELAKEDTLDEIAIAWYKGNVRTADFVIEVSIDGNTWHKIFSGTSSGATLDPETYNVVDSLARYVRIVGSGNSQNEWNSIVEVYLVGYSNAQELAIFDTTASSNDGNIPINTLDGDYSTRWSAEGDGEFITFELEDKAKIDSLGIAWYKGDERIADYQIELSLDGSSWTQVYTGISSGKTLATQIRNIPDTNACYLRIVGLGNTENNWNSITEVSIYGSPSTEGCNPNPPDPPSTATLFVSPSGKDSNSGTNSSEPFETVQHALDVANPGDVIHLADGYYDQDVATIRNGQQNAPIVITGSHNAIIRGAGHSRIFQIHHDYVHLTGFTIDGLHDNDNPDEESSYRDKLLYIVPEPQGDGVTGVKVMNMVFRNAGGEALRIKSFASDIEIAFNTFEIAGVYDYKFNDGGKNGEAIYIGTSPSQLDGNSVDESQDIWVHHNNINVFNEGVNTKEGTKEILIEYNTITGSCDKNAGGINIQGEDSIVRYNEIHGVAGAGVRLGESTGTGDNVARGVRNSVYFNKIYGFGKDVDINEIGTETCKDVDTSKVDTKIGAIKIESSPQGEICGNDIGLLEGQKAVSGDGRYATAGMFSL